MKKVITMEQWLDWHEMGDVDVIENLLNIVGPNEELEQLSIDCWKHEIFMGEDGEAYEDFKERFCEITSEYVIDWDEDL